ncbi:sigma-54 interaction domain-containing protein [Acetobacterium bakii]|uniref:sigma-54 interaction domain-containing protein n=1 Tax=Acetobacterium bakii TaxID=52689 RepID=UPI00068039DC|nr:sigma 54-interacting transcriptional regulator [Acetobacterium bakii]
MNKASFNHSPEYLEYLANLDKDFYIDILENSHNEVYVTNKEGKIIYVNPNSIRNYGLKPEDLIGKNNYDIWRGKWNPPVIQRCIEERRTIFAEQNYLITGKDITTIVTPIFDDESEIKYVLCIVQEAVKEYDISYKNINAEAFEKKQIRETKKKRKFKSEIIGYSYDFCKILVRMQRVAHSEVPVMILGESGTGKSLLAEYIHENSNRKDNPFIMINCAAIPETLLESELFGYAPYAFTGANPKGKTGLIEMADSGTLFLDEIGDLAPSLQAKLLDVLENKRFIPVGGNEIRSVDIRIITATNRKIENLVKEKKFREDLYWRINISTTTIPPLRDRRDDILPLLSFYLNKNNIKYGKKKDFSPNVIGILLEYPWPGNVRQLKNLVELLFIMASGNTIGVNHLPEFILDEIEEPQGINPNSYEYIIDSVKKSVIRDFYKKHPTSRELGVALGLSQTKANRLINQYCGDIINAD